MPATEVRQLEFLRFRVLSGALGGPNDGAHEYAGIRCAGALSGGTRRNLFAAIRAWMGRQERWTSTA